MTLITQRFIAGSGTFPASGPLPQSITKTGTISSLSTIVTGTGTLFTTELVRGDYLYNASTNEVRRIDAIFNDTTLVISSAFTTTELSGAALRISRAQYLSIGIIATGAAQKDNIALTSGQFISLNSNNCVAPFTYSGAVTFDVSYLGS